MRIFGYNFSVSKAVKADALVLPNPRQSIDTNILPPFGTNPPERPFTEASPDLSVREIHTDPRELWYLALPSKLTPNQVLMILRAALGGDIWQQWQLLTLMLDSWPMLRKCSHELRSAVAETKFHVRPFAEPGSDPTPEAQRRADTVERAILAFRPDGFTDEAGWSGLIYHLTDALLNGITLIELLWHQKASRNGTERYPRAACWVHPRHFTFTNDGRLTIFDDMYHRLTWSLAQSGVGPDPDKYLCAQFRSRSGSSLGAGLMRPLAWWWSAVVFNREWMLNFAQKYGNPFLDATFKQGSSSDEIAKINSLLAKAGSQGWFSHVHGTEVQIHSAQSLGADNAQVALMKMADEACQYLLLGQTATTHGTAGKLGNDTERGKVRRECVEGLAKWVSSDVLSQFAAAVLRVNYGDDEMLPSIEPDFTEDTDPVAQAQRDQVFIQNKVPMLAEEFYRNNKMTMPEEGDQVVVGGRIGKLGAIDEEISLDTPLPSVQAPGSPPSNKPTEPVPNAKSNVQQLVNKATDEELIQLSELLVKAKQANRLNGEWEQVQVIVKELESRL